MNILIAGRKGQVAQALIAQHSSHNLIALGRDDMDISQMQQVAEAVTKHQPDIIINAAAYTAVDKAESEVEQARAINETGTLNLAQVCAAQGIPLLHISTDYVFDGSKHSPYTEADPVSPLGVYGESKLAGEQAVQQHLERHIILRTSWVFGEQGHNFVRTMLRLATDRDKLNVVADQQGGPTSAQGIAACLLRLCDVYADKQTLSWGLYNFSGEPYTSWHGFAKAIMASARRHDLLHHDVVVNPITTQQYPTPARRPANSRLNNEKIKQTFAIAADDWQQALDGMIKRRLV